MKRRFVVLAVPTAFMSFLSNTIAAATVGLGVTAVHLTSPNHGDSNIGPLSNLSAEFPLGGRFALGASYSAFESLYSDDYYVDQGSGTTEVGQNVVSVYFWGSVIERGVWTTYAKVGGGRYESSLGSLSTSREGLYAGAGERYSVVRRLTVSLEAQYHFASFGSDNDYPPTGELFRLLAGVEFWIGTRN